MEAVTGGAADQEFVEILGKITLWKHVEILG